jgi:hypothetical protein
MFLSPLDVRWTGKQSFDLINYLVYENDTFTITIYPSFDYDGASIPRALWSVIGCPMGELYSRAACLHDALYASRIFDRKTCDKLFHEAMLSDGVSRSLAKQMYLAVRAFGDSAFQDGEVSKYRELIQVEIK